MGAPESAVTPWMGVCGLQNGVPLGLGVHEGALTPWMGVCGHGDPPKWGAPGSGGSRGCMGCPWGRSCTCAGPCPHPGVPHLSPTCSPAPCGLEDSLEPMGAVPCPQHVPQVPESSGTAWTPWVLHHVPVPVSPMCPPRPCRLGDSLEPMGAGPCPHPGVPILVSPSRCPSHVPQVPEGSGTGWSPWALRRVPTVSPPCPLSPQEEEKSLRHRPTRDPSLPPT